MKIKIRYTILFVFVAHIFSAQDTIIIYFNKDGVLITDKTQAAYYRKAFKENPGVKIWSARDYLINNKLYVTGTYTSDKLNVKTGHFIYFFENGQKKSEGKYNNNQAEGLWKYWYENGARQGEGNFYNDHREDTWTYWHENGQKKSEGKFSLSQKKGLWQYWDEKGHLDFEEVCNSGKTGSVQWYFENNAPKATGFFLNGKRTGEWRFWNIAGKAYLEGSYLNGKQHGEWTRYFENGQSMKIEYENGIIKNKQLGGIVRNE